MSSSEAVLESARGPLVTIAIPTFNRAALLRRCVQLALSQTYSNIEVLVSDNASTDDTPKVLHELRNQRLRVVRQETNIGLLPNWNACLAAARGEYIVFASDDDEISPQLVERCVDAVGIQSHVPIVVALNNFHMSSLRQVRPARSSTRIGTGLQKGIDVLLEFLNDEIIVAMCGMIVRTEALRAGGGMPLELRHTADVAAWAPLLFEDKVGFVNDACATINFHDSSETSRLHVSQILNDGWKVASLIERMSDERIKDESLREKVKLSARRCFARKALVFLAYHRRNGASLREVLTLVWRSRSDLASANKLSVLKFAAIVLSPRFVAEGLRLLRPAFSHGWHNRQTVDKRG